MSEITIKREPWMRVVAITRGGIGRQLGMYDDEVCRDGTCDRPPNHDGERARSGDVDWPASIAERERRSREQVHVITPADPAHPRGHDPHLSIHMGWLGKEPKPGVRRSSVIGCRCGPIDVYDVNTWAAHVGIAGTIRTVQRLLFLEDVVRDALDFPSDETRDRLRAMIPL